LTSREFVGAEVGGFWRRWPNAQAEQWPFDEELDSWQGLLGGTNWLAATVRRYQPVGSDDQRPSSLIQ
jgi:hypothetical protein